MCEENNVFTFLNPNDPSFFPGLEKFKNLVQNIADRDEVTRLYLKSRAERLKKIKLNSNK